MNNYKKQQLLASVGTPLIFRAGKYAAFSLVEMLMALLVASLLMVALAPVITKRPMHATYEKEENAQTGIRVYTNPGNYAFEVPDNVSNIRIQAAGGGGGGAGASLYSYKRLYTSGTTTFKVPKGVYEMSFTLVGGGGGGGAAYATKTSDSCNHVKIPYVADSGRDLCYVPTVLTSENLSMGYLHVVDALSSSTYTRTCWVGTTFPNARNVSGSADASTRAICTHAAMRDVCTGTYFTSQTGGKTGRLITVNEMKTIMNEYPYPSLKYLRGNYLDLVCYQCKDTNFPSAGDYTAGCNGGSHSGYCKPSVVVLDDGYFQFYFSPYGTETAATLASPVVTTNILSGVPRCVYEVMDWFPYTGGGGASGSKLVHKIKVKPDDTVELSVAEGGTYKNSAGQRGPGGGTSFLYHTSKETGYTKTYYAKGGLGGNAATQDSSAAAIDNKPNCSSEGVCTIVYSSTNGEGTILQGGSGAGGAKGGTMDSPVGADATVYAAGGGGGACGRKVRTPSLCSGGGAGAGGYIEVEYFIASPGGGGGAGGAVGYNSEENVSESINLQVNSKDVINITVGSGGPGGGANSSGFNGKDTVLVTKKGAKYVFKGGLGGKTGTFSASDVQIGGEGGLGGNYPDSEYKEYKEVVAPLSAKGLKGASDLYGFAGGEGGKTVTGYFGGCGGMQISDDGRCNSNTENGTDALMYNAANNRYGGAGGGGGGMNYLNKTPGHGGSGADGFLLIKWGT